ncbi:alpha/beta fold hydrolase [Nodosilinea sp. LEGE 07298]|uniref:alpha/beta fold hydrolase n=1 Tax=Nodosilinea sp. LEGE 07298 TaxID=2777970 RepID=UPI001882801B|nr:alpha/beta fold hydrolase [Nodosilinea sp. LEGE 07298]MBE9113696.1 alpha/beta fold hydrolase [Nodosilinea sp. LEGE 07298]
MPTDRYIQVDGINTRYWALGEEGSPVLLIHGQGGAIDYWYKNVFALAQHHQVYALDWVGSGMSDKPKTTYTVDDISQFIFQFMDALGLPQASLIAGSIGGAIALKMALAVPERIEKLVLIGAGGLGKEVALPARLTSLPVVGEVLNHPSPRAAKFMVQQCIYDPEPYLHDEAFMDLVLRNMASDVLQFQTRTFRTMGNVLGMKPNFWRSIHDRLAEIQSPTLLIWGKQDWAFPISHGELAAKVMPNAQLQVFDSCGHLPYLEHADVFNHVVLDFLVA